MLYVSTRNKTDSFTSHWALHNDRTPDGGMYVPYQLPYYNPQQIAKLKERSFGEIAAQILNRFFSARLTGWDVEFCIGRYPAKLVPMRHKVILAEIWHNPGVSFEYALNHLYTRICGTETAGCKPSAWSRIAVYIAVLFSIYAETSRNGIPAVDIVVPADDPTVAIAAWYARRMGLPLGTIVLACKDSSSVWDMVQKGTLNVNSFHSPFTEHLIYQVLGREQLRLCMQECNRRGVFQFAQTQLTALNQSLYAVVAGDDRIRSVIGSVYRTNTCIFSPLTALSFGCLQDYRSHTGESRSTLLLADCSPILYIDDISAATGISVAELKKMLTLIKE